MFNSDVSLFYSNSIYEIASINYGVTSDNKVVLLDTGGITLRKILPQVSWYVSPPTGIETPRYKQELSLGTIEDSWETDLRSIMRSTFLNPDLEDPLKGIIESAVRESPRFAGRDHAMVAGEGAVPVGKFLQEAGIRRLDTVSPETAGSEAFPGSDRKGGIDLNATPLKIKVKNRDPRLPVLPMPRGEYLEIEGLIPVIQSITPMPSLAPLLGQSEESQKDRVSSLE